jgi:DNA-binding MarR family transcriptional regulator
VIPLDFVLGLGTGLACAAGLYLLLRHVAHRTQSSPTPPPPGSGSPSTSREGMARDAASPSEAETPHPVTLLPETPVRRAEGASRPGPGRVPVPANPATAAELPSERIRLSHRVILHVFAQGTLPPGAIAPLGLSQAGIGQGLGIPQAGLAAVLRRLEAAGVLVGERAHVQGRDRRLKVYRLTARGLELAKELRPVGSLESADRGAAGIASLPAPRLRPRGGPSLGQP